MGLPDKRWTTLLLLGFLLFWDGPSSAANHSVPPSKERFIILTFDDGPRSKLLPGMLAFLKEKGIKAVFFVQGWQAKEHPELLKKIHQEGHEIANHTYGHGRLNEMLERKSPPDKKGRRDWKKGKEWIFRDLERGSGVIRDAAGYQPRFFRPPHWDLKKNYPAGWVQNENTPEAPCQTYWKEWGSSYSRLLKKKREFPDSRIFAEEFICRGYIVQLPDTPQLLRVLLKKTLEDEKMRAGPKRNPEEVTALLRERAVKMREARDVNTTDYEFHSWYGRNKKQATAALITKVQKLIKVREGEGVYVHVLVFHELPVSLDALKNMVPEWQSAGYQFRTLRWAYGICENPYRC